VINCLVVEFDYKSSNGYRKSNKGKNKKIVYTASIISALSTLFLLLYFCISFHDLQNSIPSVSAISQDQQFTTLPQKLHFSRDLTVTINSGQPPNVGNFNVTKGYKIEPVLWNLTLPSSVAFDDTGNTYIAEAGYAHGELETTPQILKIDVNGTISTFVDRHLYGPITDIAYHQGKLYVSNRGKISTVDIQNHHVQDIIMALPGLGDHYVDQMGFGPDGRLYFGIGTATNSGVVGEDNYEWLKLLPTFHDIPAKEIKLTGQNFKSGNALSPLNPNDKNVTGAFSPFGNASNTSEIVKGNVKCSGCILSAKPDGTDLNLVAWGIRDPYGLTFDKDGKHLMVTDSGAEERGSRPIANDGPVKLSNDNVYSLI
jgi:glucose/arabinose dehydrogenase